MDGVQRLRAWFSGRAFETHRHDTYAIGVTERGVQDFDYRGAALRALPGDVVVLHPDEPHDGRAGGPDGFGYRIIYIEPARVAEAARAIRGRPGPLPFVREVVTRNRALAAAVSSAFRDDGDADAAVVRLTERLLDASGAGGAVRLDDVAVARARELLDAETARVVGSAELEAVSGLTRYELARQFRAALGTSPYRYSVMRRIDRARRELDTGSTLADVAATTGFADQAHFTRVFKARLGVTPARYRALVNSPSRARS